MQEFKQYVYIYKKIFRVALFGPVFQQVLNFHLN